MNLDLAVRQPHVLPRRSLIPEKLSNVAWNKAAFIVFWEGQGHLSSLAYVALVAFASIWLAFGAMMVWSITAAIVFYVARERGYPNMLSEVSLPKRQAGSLASYAFPGELASGELRQGGLESSNVDLVEELIDLTVAQRAYEVNSQVIRAADEILRINNSLRR